MGGWGMAGKGEGAITGPGIEATMQTSERAESQGSRIDKEGQGLRESSEQNPHPPTHPFTGGELSSATPPPPPLPIGPEF